MKHWMILALFLLLLPACGRYHRHSHSTDNQRNWKNQQQDSRQDQQNRDANRRNRQQGRSNN